MIRSTSVVLALAVAACASSNLAVDTRAKVSETSSIERGRYLVQAMDCATCHTPFTMGPNGPEPDTTRFLSGHPESVKITSAPKLDAPWGMAGSMTNTAWAGPWGVSFTMNLTPDDETGLGKWTFDEFQMAMRTGRHLGRGRPILPPMPAQAVGSLNEEDLRAVYDYLKSVPAIKNRVPDPLPPVSAQ